MTAAALAALVAASPGPGAPRPAPFSLPPRIRQVVIHVPGGPSFRDPARRFRFFTPEAVPRNREA